MNFINLIFSPEGKIGRLQFLAGYVMVTILVFLFYLIPILILMFMYSSSETFYGVTGTAEGGGLIDLRYMHTNLLADFWKSLLIFVPATFIFIYSKICLDIKRFRDTGFSPWFILLFLIPYVNILVLGFLLVFPGREED